MSWLVIGAGISGTSAARLLRKKGESVSISDCNVLSHELKAEFEKLNIKIFEGLQSPDQLKGIKNIVLSPGVPLTIPLVKTAIEKKINVLSELDLVLRDYKGTVIAVTGTNGKSTTCTMIGHILAHAGLDVSVGGNLGTPPSMMLEGGSLKKILVLEVSSYQLELTKYLFPKVSLYTSFSQDHLTRHKTMEEYFKVKWRLFTNTAKDGLVITTPQIWELSKKYGCSLPQSVNSQVVTKDDLPDFSSPAIKTKHDRLNSVFSLLAASYILGREPKDLYKYLSDFKTLPHRFEHIGLVNGKPVINDSKATNVESVIAALENIYEPCLLLLGGRGKGESFSPLIDYSSKISHAICFGESGLIIREQIKDKISTTYFPTLAITIEKLLDFVQKKPLVILFSPGCASFDEFKNFEDRGCFFRKKMQLLLDK